MASFEVYVVDRRGNPVARKEVTVFLERSSLNPLTWPTTHLMGLTDEDGHARFEQDFWDNDPPLTIDIHVEGKSQKEKFRDGAGFSIVV